MRGWSWWRWLVCRVLKHRMEQTRPARRIGPQAWLREVWTCRRCGEVQVMMGAEEMYYRLGRLTLSGPRAKVILTGIEE